MSDTDNIFDRLLNDADRRRGDPPSEQGGSLLDGGGDDSGPDPTGGRREDDDRRGDERLPAAVRGAVQALLKHGYVESGERGETFRVLTTHPPAVDRVLDPMDLTMRLDTLRGIAVVMVRCDDDDDRASVDDSWSHPLVKRQRLTLEQSLVVALLRQAFVIHEQESGVGDPGGLRIPVDDLMTQYLTYIEPSGSQARDETKLTHVLEQLKVHGIVSAIDGNHEITVRPLIVHVADPGSLAGLLAVLRRQAGEVDLS